MYRAKKTVGFQEGTREAYDNLKIKDKDTLYFVKDSADSTKGVLYLGDTLIDGGLTQESIINNLEHITESQKEYTVPSVKLLEQYAEIKEVKEIIEIEVQNQITTGGTGNLDGGDL